MLLDFRHFLKRTGFHFGINSISSLSIVRWVSAFLLHLANFSDQIQSNILSESKSSWLQSDCHPSTTFWMHNQPKTRTNLNGFVMPNGCQFLSPDSFGSLRVTVWLICFSLGIIPFFPLLNCNTDLKLFKFKFITNLAPVFELSTTTDIFAFTFNIQCCVRLFIVAWMTLSSSFVHHRHSNVNWHSFFIQTDFALDLQSKLIIKIRESDNNEKDKNKVGASTHTRIIFLSSHFLVVKFPWYTFCSYKAAAFCDCLSFLITFLGRDLRAFVLNVRSRTEPSIQILMPFVCRVGCAPGRHVISSCLVNHQVLTKF